ncbi:MAG: hypothetical protein EXR75_01600 [Myxococcales bacterium]|nr:hypothetical protein [Myxococcales bacterium]
MGLVAATQGGCIVGGVYAYKANSAAASLEQAKVLGADRLAGFEYYFAEANLEKAMEEAAEASYGDAILFCDLANEFAEKAIVNAKAAHESGGR